MISVEWRGNSLCTLHFPLNTKKEGDEVKKICKNCGAEFEPKRKSQVFCDIICSSEYYIKRRNEKKYPVFKKICVVCGAEFETRKPRKKTCCLKCSDEYSKNRRQYKPYKKVCAICGKEFETPYKYTKTCCRKCSLESRKKTYAGLKADAEKWRRHLEETEK